MKSRRVLYGFSPLRGLGDIQGDQVPAGAYAGGYMDPYAPAGSSTNPNGPQLSIPGLPSFDLRAIPMNAWLAIGLVGALVLFKRR